MTVNLLAELVGATPITPDSAGWYVPSCGHPIPIASGAAVSVTDCPACEPPVTQAPAGRRLSAPAPLPAPGDRPDPRPGSADGAGQQRAQPARTGK